MSEAKFLFEKGIKELELENYQEAALNFQKSLDLAPNRISTLTNLALAFIKLNKVKEGEEIVEKIISIEPLNEYANLLSGHILFKKNKLTEAVAYYKKAIEINSNNDEAYFSIGLTLQKLKKYEKSIIYFLKSLKLNDKKPEYYLYSAISYENIGEYEEAISCCDEALKRKPYYAEAYDIKGLVEQSRKNYQASIYFYNKAKEINPRYINAYLNLGAVYEELKEYANAIENYRYCIKIDPNYFLAIFNIGKAYLYIKEYKKALTYLENAYCINHDHENLLGIIVQLLLTIADWEKIEKYLLRITDDDIINKKLMHPFTALLLYDKPKLNLRIAEKYNDLSAKCKNIKKTQFGKNKIRIGYFGDVFYYHPISIWLIEQLEKHDKNVFELYGFSSNSKIKDPMNLRIRNALNSFYEIDNLTEIQTSELIKEIKIDIAVDLVGLTSKAFENLFNERIAPIQINHLGWPGTTGRNCIDYTFMDEDDEMNTDSFTEKIVTIPNIYTYDSKRIVDKENITRSKYNLPEGVFIFTNQNSIYKLNKVVFKTWLNILKKLPNSILWLQEPNEDAKSRIVSMAESYGIKKNRIFYNKREIVQPDNEIKRISEYLATYTISDLFLDTWPYTAGTTATMRYGLVCQFLVYAEKAKPRK